MKRILIVLVSVIAFCVLPMHAQGLYEISSARIGEQKPNSNYRPMVGFGSSYSSGVGVSLQFHAMSASRPSFGTFVSADNYIASVSVAPPSVRRVSPWLPGNDKDGDTTLEGLLTEDRKLPLPDGTYVLLLLAAGYVAGVAIRRRKAQTGR